MTPEGALFLAPFAILGLALINTGLCRARNAAHLMVSGLCLAAIGMLVRALLPGGGPVSVETWHGMMAAALAAVIPLGSGAERWRFGPACVSGALSAAVTIALLRWLPATGVVDSGGAAAIHASAGFTALAVTWVLGPRRGKYSKEGVPSAFPGHSVALVLAGCFLAWIGLVGLNAAGAPARAMQAAVNTSVSAAAAGLAAAALTRARFGKTDASLTANGWTAGLVAASAGCGVLTPAASVLIGLGAGLITIYAIELLELRLFVDDPGGTIAVHGFAGLWGLMAAGGAHWMPQFVAAATVVGLVLPLAYIFNSALNQVYRLRATADAERHGLDLHELGAGAYPDFASHNEDPWAR